jgi:hypothetical protein
VEQGRVRLAEPLRAATERVGDADADPFAEVLELVGGD